MNRAGNKKEPISSTLSQTRPGTAQANKNRTRSTTVDVPDKSSVYPVNPVSGAFLKWLRKHADEIKSEWAHRLSTLSGSYVETTLDELAGTVSGAFEGNFEYLSSGRLDQIQQFIDYITEKRLQAGFALSDVQKAFELFRVIVTARLKSERRLTLLAESVASINGCLSYTIHKFSDHYQHMHELSITEHARNLEQAISVRTAELAASERRYKTLVEGINDGYFVIQDQRIIFANRAFCSMHRAPLKKTLGRLFLDFVAPESRENLLKAYGEIMNGESGPGPVQYLLAKEPVEHSYREVRARLADLGVGPVIIGICRDISERVSMEAKVREHEQMAYVGRLSASLSHEIRNPLSSIKMNLQILERKLELDGYDRRRLEITVHEVSRLEDILRQLLDTARPLTLNKAPGDVTSIARRCVELLEPKAQEKSLRIIERHSKGIPTTELDSAKIEQAVINLLLNAIDAAPYGGRVSIWTKLVEGNEFPSLELGVRDNGPEIPPDQARQLFTPFSTSKTHGSGLGLSNVKRIVEAHSGAIEARSRKGQGATFLIKLPILTRS
ncbi:MAG: ATP-binding protein [Desulfomonilaceae bacterium]